MTTPLAQAMIVCDAIHRDLTTGKFFLLGTFSTIFAKEVPLKHPRLSLFIVITECHGTTPVTVKLVRVQPESGQDEVLATVQAEIKSPNPLLVHELGLQLKDVLFEHAGEYRFQLESDGEPLLEKRLVVHLRKRN